jgi:hypothetical protein
VKKISNLIAADGVTRATIQASLAFDSLLLGFSNTQQPQTRFARTNDHTKTPRPLSFADALMVRALVSDSYTPRFAHDPIKVPSYSDGS